MKSDKISKGLCLRIKEFANEDETNLRHKCGCLLTSEKLKQILERFPKAPPPPPPTPDYALYRNPYQHSCISAYCNFSANQLLNSIQSGSAQVVPIPVFDVSNSLTNKLKETNDKQVGTTRSWRIITDLVHIIQLSVTATALAFYYLIYCYMQLIYYTLRSAIYFHHADGPMKITIGVVTVTSIVVGLNLIIRLERLIGIFPNKYVSDVVVENVENVDSLLQIE